MEQQSSLFNCNVTFIYSVGYGIGVPKTYLILHLSQVVLTLF